MKAAERLVAIDSAYRKEWESKNNTHEQQVSERLAEIGVESPKQLRRQVKALRSKVRKIKTETQPRLDGVNEKIAQLETERQNFRTQLRNLNGEITTARKNKAEELTESLKGQIIVSVDEAGDSSKLLKVLHDICVEIASQQHKIKNREQQLRSIVEKVEPLELAEALRNFGRIQHGGGETSLTELCGVTENTQNVLCSIANDILLLNRIETTDVPDVPKIEVRRDGEENRYADLSTGLSPGEQSAAILTLALETRARPLVIDQPEDELGHSYIVNLTIPKILTAKFRRQIIAVNLQANVPVLGDADYVIKMENRARPEGRECIVAVSGCFEDRLVTKALVELEGGERAFQFRQHRYSLTHTGKRIPAPTPLTGPHFPASRTRKDLGIKGG